MTNRQLHRLKKRWLAEGYFAAVHNTSQLNEGWASAIGKSLGKGAKSLLKGAGRAAVKHGKTALKHLVIEMLADTLPSLLKEKGTQLARKISATSQDKAKASKNAFAQLMYTALAKIPIEDAINLTVDELSDSLVHKINGKLSEADGYVSPSEEEVEDILNAYKAKKMQAA